MCRFAARLSVFFLLAAVIGVLAPNSWGQVASGKVEDKLSEQSQAASERKKKLITQELHTLKDHPWAGDYYYGDGLGVNVRLSLAPKSGFVFTWNGCLGLYDLNYGDVVEMDGKIKLIFKYPNERKGFQGIPPELIPIVWGKRHYLIPADAVVGFANAINAGFEPGRTVGSDFLLRDRDERKAVSGQPNIPVQYSGYILKAPIKAEISAIKGSRLEDSARITTVMLNVGSEQGVKEGMKFYVYSPAAIFESAQITTVESSNSEARIVQDLADEKRGRPSTDWKLSTSSGRD